MEKHYWSEDSFSTSASSDKRNSPSDYAPSTYTRRFQDVYHRQFIYEFNDPLHRPRRNVVRIHHIRLQPLSLVVATKPKHVDTYKTMNDSVHSTRDESLLLCLYTAARTQLQIPQSGCIEGVHPVKKHSSSFASSRSHKRIFSILTSVTVTLQDGSMLTVASPAVQVDLWPLCRHPCSPRLSTCSPLTSTPTRTPYRSHCDETTMVSTASPLTTQGMVIPHARASSFVGLHIHAHDASALRLAP